MELQTDFLIVGGGIAGLSLAAKLARLGQVTVLSKKKADVSASELAQGGIASVTSPDDSFDLHFQDTLRAGDGLCHEDIVDIIVHQAPDRVRELEEWGVRFTKSGDGSFDLGQGGACRRLYRQGDPEGAHKPGAGQPCNIPAPGPCGRGCHYPVPHPGGLF